MQGEDLFAHDPWCALDFISQRELLAATLAERLPGDVGIRAVTVAAGPAASRYDLTAVVETDVGRLRTPLWSHARAMLYCDPSIHPANREAHGPLRAIDDAADRLCRRLSVPYKLEARGLTFTLSLESGVERTWTAEHARFRKRTAVTREDRVERPGELDVRDLLAHFYTGPSLRMVSEDGEAFLLPGAAEVEGSLVTLCGECGSWSENTHAACPRCGSAAVDVVIAARPGGASV